MAEGPVTDLINQLASVVAREAEQEIRLVVGVEKEIEKLKDNLRTVQAVLNDAEKKQVTDETVKVWLEKLNNVCYKLEDVVDEWNTELIKSAIQKGLEENADNAPVLKKQVCSFIPSPSCCFGQVDKLTRRHDIAHKIKELNGILDDITKERVSYGFELTNYPAFKVVDDRPQTTSYVDVSEILGRDKVKNDLVSILLGRGTEKEKHSYVVSLVGMGGVGKTALAQLAYNDHEVQAHFEIKVWVCVSNPFDQCKVAKEILESIVHQSPTLTTLQSLLDRICNEVRGKKFLLVFDDVWAEDSTTWEPFRIALECGSQGSRIVVTTRKSRVAEIMGSASMINLKVLSEEDCWLVFSKIAFFNRDLTQCEQLEGLARQIVEKCKGLPLAAKTVGSLMRFKRSMEEWRRVLDSNLWELEDEEIKSLYAPLLLSYYDLSSPLRRCFSFCAVFPKDYVFSSDELVFMWMALGYIESKKNVEIEIIARDYFENLAVRSFFQDFERDENDDKIEKCKMHDIVHDFAQLMSKNVCFTINSNIGLETDYKTAHHLELEIPQAVQFPESIYNAKNLRTLILISRSDYMLSTLFQHFRCLRILTLDFKFSGTVRNLPDAVENFIHLRYLKLVNYCGDALPETICNICNLQILNIISDRFQKLPQGMSKLINLRHFNLDFRSYSFETNNVKFPRGFGRLTSLRTLRSFSVNGKDDGERCKLGELKNLNHLQGTLAISGLGSEVDECEAMNAQLKKKINLHTLKLIFNEWDGEEIIREKDALVLNALEPPPNLEYLGIEYYKAPIMFPNWTMSLTNLKELGIYCSSLECLPPLGKLPFLKSLRMSNIERLKKLGAEFMGIEESEKKEKGDIIIPLFPNLISLSFAHLCNWEEWNGIEEEEDCIRRFNIMPRLQDLTITYCIELKSLPNFLRTTPLQKLEISCCSILEERCKRGTGKDWPKISHIPNIRIHGIHVQRDGQECESKPKYYEEDFDEDDDQNEESNEDEVDEEFDEDDINSSGQKKFEIEEIGNEASSQLRQPEGIQVEEMQLQASSTLKPQGVVFDVEAIKILKSSEMELEASEQHGLFLMQGGLGLTKPPKDEDWKNAKEIYLMDNELSDLPENPRCPNLLALFLPRNYKLRMIPQPFFNFMPALQILNLSRTGIKSLPDSLIRLVSLKRLFLNDCHRLMILSPKVGDLKQLEVLDLEGANILDLPKEIKNLTNLTCLEVSFYGYTSNGRRTMQSNAVVPCGVISALSQLEELNIDVNPDDEQWDACVEDIVNEVCTLKRLETLKFYFPKVELLSHFHWNSLKLSHFRFNVGRHVKRIMSRVPRDVEFELERWERCLKYINGVGVPRDIKNVLQHVTAFFLDRHVTIKKLSDFGTRNMKELKCCVVGECNEVQVIIDAEDAYGEEGIGEIVSESYDAERIVLGSLEYLYIYYMKSLRSIWEGSVQQNSLFLLKSLTLRTCPMLTTIFTQGLLDNLCNLEELKVEDCSSIKSIVSCGNFAELRTSHFLPNLKKILLHYMPGLVSISSGLHIAPQLEFLSLYNCPNLKNPLVDEVSSQDLKKIKGERSWWEALEWSNGRPCYLDEIFVPTDM